MAKRPTTIDQYLAGLDPVRRAALEKVRRAVRAAAPGAEECISYGMPAFRRGRVIAGFAAFATHCSYFPFSGKTLEALGERLRGYERTRSALHFPAERPLPASLVRELVKARIAEFEGRSPKGRASRPARTARRRA